MIPPKRNRKEQRGFDREFYREQHLIECFFGKLKHFRRMFSRFDRKAGNFLGFAQFASVLIWLR